MEFNSVFLYFQQIFPEQRPKDFDGVTLDKPPQLEDLFQVNIIVYSLEPLDQSKTVAHPVVHSLNKYDNMLYLNLYKNHFSYIKDMKKYAKSYACSRCGKYWKHVGKLHRHEKTCEAKIRYKFPGGVFKNPKTIFELLEEEAISIPEENLRLIKHYKTLPMPLPNAARRNLLNQLSNPTAIGGANASAAAPVAAVSGLTNPAQTPAAAAPAPASDTNMAMMTMILQLQEQLRQMQGSTATSTNTNPNANTANPPQPHVNPDLHEAGPSNISTDDANTTPRKKNKKRKQPVIQEVDDMFEVASSSKKKK